MAVSYVTFKIHLTVSRKFSPLLLFLLSHFFQNRLFSKFQPKELKKGQKQIDAENIETIKFYQNVIAVVMVSIKLF